MKKLKISITAIALVLGIASVYASNQKKATTTYTVNGVSVGLATIQRDCPGGSIACGNEYKNGEFFKEWPKN